MFLYIKQIFIICRLVYSAPMQMCSFAFRFFFAFSFSFAFEVFLRFPFFALSFLCVSVL